MTGYGEMGLHAPLPIRHLPIASGLSLDKKNEFFSCTSIKKWYYIDNERVGKIKRWF